MIIYLFTISLVWFFVSAVMCFSMVVTAIVEKEAREITVIKSVWIWSLLTSIATVSHFFVEMQ